MTESLTFYRRSELQTVREGCLYRFHQIWRNGVDDTSDLALTGIGFHAINHRYVLRLMAQQIPNDHEEAVAAFEDGIAAARTPNRLIPGLRDLWDFHAKNYLLPVDRFVAAEERQASGDVTWAPDLVLANPTNNELEIVDFKSGWAPPPTEDELRDLFQARVYTFYGMQTWKNFASYRFTLSAVRWNKTVSVVFTLEDLDNVERELRAHIRTIEDAEQANQWPAVPGESCRYCQLVCPIESPALIPQRILTPVIRQQLGGYVIAQEAQIRGIKKVLKADVAVNGPLTINGVVWANRPVIERKYPVDRVMAALKALKLDQQAEVLVKQGADLTLSYSSLKKLFKLYPELQSALAAYEQSKEKYRFSAKAAGQDDEDGSDE